MFEFCAVGVRWRVGVPFFVLIAALLTLDASGTAVLCLLASFLHEGGHVMAMLLCGHSPREVTVGICGIRLVPDGRPLGYRAQMRVLAAGPLTNLAAAGVLIACRCLPVAAAAHIWLGVFNLLPIEALDGGQLLRCLLLLRTDAVTAARVVRGVSAAVLLPLAVLGFFWLMRFQNMTLLFVSVYLIVRLFADERI